MTEFQAYLLAAGDGLRAGGPKAWRVHEGKSLLERQLEFLTGRFAPERVAVSIQPAWLERCRALAPGVRWVPEDPSRKPMDALLALVAALPLARWSFLHHVDMPVWEPALFDALAAKAGPHAEALAPSYRGRKGHPILLSPALAEPLARLDPRKDRLDYWLRTRKEDVLEVPFACVHENWNHG